MGRNHTDDTTKRIPKSSLQSVIKTIKMSIPCHRFAVRFVYTIEKSKGTLFGLLVVKRLALPGRLFTFGNRWIGLPPKKVPLREALFWHGNYSSNVCPLPKST